MEQRGPRCPHLEPGEPTLLGEETKDPQRDEKTLWTFTAVCRWDLAVGAECRREPLIPVSPGAGGGDHGTPLSYS